MKKSNWAAVVIGVIVIIIIGVHLYGHDRGKPSITTFEECAAAGNPVQESYPARCTADGQTFTQSVPEGTVPTAPTSTVTTPPPPVATSSVNIRVSAPAPYQTIGGTLTIKGEAREFESAFAWRLRDADGSVLAEGHGMANAPDVGQFGPFTVSTTYKKPKGTHGTVQVFAYSAKDGSEIDTVSIPVNF